MQAFLPLVVNHDRDEIALCPSDTSLSVVIAAVTGSNVAVGAQNMYFADEGAFTGETSPLMLKAVNATHVILGHSERRQYFCETDETVNKKLHAALKHGLKPIVCIGEVLAERESGKTEEVLLRQVRKAFEGVTAEQAEPVVIAYEPVWAIGTGKTATRRNGCRGARNCSQGDSDSDWQASGDCDAHSLRRQRQAGERISADEYGRDRRCAGGRRQSRSSIICENC